MGGEDEERKRILRGGKLEGGEVFRRRWEVVEEGSPRHRLGVAVKGSSTLSLLCEKVRVSVPWSFRPHSGV